MDGEEQLGAWSIYWSDIWGWVAQYKNPAADERVAYCFFPSSRDAHAFALEHRKQGEPIAIGPR